MVRLHFHQNGVPLAFQGTTVRSNRDYFKLGERVGVAHSFIHRLETGKKLPNLQMVLKLATALGIRPGDLVNEMADRIATK
ncbi:helix-turn-helix domain-containing protein [Desulfovibrio sp. OH1186_COT-070]|uniref:helix-turn-helix domain-containing protein n=1 Tax=unclassified Desulfovibrio TaxID=2593640 RepID=UPI000F5ED223|nr:XRE family transcriptional regulator [Desulfovibrio sp. OH1209_COT-279]RRD88199.1 XRE family transcriptional regulator [Desulfovibrio sp. OH1186_COT-070]